MNRARAARRVSLSRNSFNRLRVKPSTILGAAILGALAMDWNRVEGSWKQVKGKVKEQWGKLTDDDLSVINGNREQLEGRIQERYGIAKDRAKAEIDAWYNRQDWS